MRVYIRKITNMHKTVFVFFLCVTISFGALFGFLYKAKTERGDLSGNRVFHIESGEDIRSIASRLERERLVSSRWYFLWSAWRGGLRGRVQAGDFVIPGNRTAPEVVSILRVSEGRPAEISLTFPEGWTAEKITARLSANQFDGEKFLELARHPIPEWKEKFPFLKLLPEGASLEGFLFPDTYVFQLDAAPEDLVESMLRNFGTRCDKNIRSEIEKQGKNFYDVIILASILEREIGTAHQTQEDIDRDRKMVSDIFWRRLSDGHRLESDATVAYIRGETKVKHSIEDISVDSPYNTYAHAGLPPGPISNPGLSSIQAAVFPIPNTFYFFLNNPETGKTFFAETFEEHKANKRKNGL